jgi:NH3-dependent NAD+ synthetase
MSGMSDEDKLGFSYTELEKVARGKTKGMDPGLVKKIKTQIKSMSFKKKLLNLPNFKYSK